MILVIILSICCNRPVWKQRRERPDDFLAIFANCCVFCFVLIKAKSFLISFNYLKNTSENYLIFIDFIALRLFSINVRAEFYFSVSQRKLF